MRRPTFLFTKILEKGSKIFWKSRNISFCGVTQSLRAAGGFEVELTELDEIDRNYF